MRFLLISLLVFCLETGSFAQTLVPNSTSPDGKMAFYYQLPPSAAPSDGFEFHVREISSGKALSNDLVPNSGSVQDETSDASLLFDQLGMQLEARRNNGPHDAAFSYFVNWSPDSQWVSIEAGAHKFWSVLVYHRVGNRFQPAALPPNADFVAFYYQHRPGSNVESLGAVAAIQKISTRNFDPPMVCWLKNGTLAIDAYPHLLNVPSYQRSDLFFVVDCQATPAAITGFCK